MYNQSKTFLLAKFRNGKLSDIEEVYPNGVNTPKLITNRCNLELNKVR